MERTSTGHEPGKGRTMKTYYSETLDRNVTVPMDNIGPMTEEDLRCLERCDIVTFRGISGVWTTVDVALEAPSLVQAYANAGDIYTLTIEEGDIVLEPTYKRWKD
jgi:hypothetical protein